MDMGAKRDGNLDLDIRQDDRFQQREWRVEQVGTVLLVLFLLAGVLGLVGKGLFNQASAASENGALEMEYQRVAHYKADQTVTFTVSEEAIEDDTVTLVLTGPWVQEVNMSSINPEPDTQYATPDGMAMEFAVHQPGDLEIDFSVMADQRWMLDAHAAVATNSASDSVSFSQLILP
ncbi:hypothetical protein [Citricoccus sp. GCM10030269]|uniref:hypothetical protein n=1 Tax=Citricoccus sp. GCM10030269 TaxID=3273388 RepID=UPI00360D246D